MSKTPIVIDNDTQEIVEEILPIKSVKESATGKSLFELSTAAINHLTESLCILLAAKNGGLITGKAPKGKKVYRAEADHSDLSKLIKLLAKNIQLQIKTRRLTIEFLEVDLKSNIKGKKVKVKFIVK